MTIRDSALLAIRRLRSQKVLTDDLRNEVFLELVPYVRAVLNNTLQEYLPADDYDDLMSEVSLYLLDRWLKKVSRKRAKSRVLCYLGATIRGIATNFLSSRRRSVRWDRATVYNPIPALDRELDGEELAKRISRDFAEYCTYRLRGRDVSDLVHRLVELSVMDRYSHGERLC